MQHVELSLSEPPTRRGQARSPLDRWAAAVSEAVEPCLVINGQAVIVAFSESCRTLLGLPRQPVGPVPLHEAIRLLDFSPAGGTLGEGELSKIPPLLALSSGRLARGLIRVQSAAGPHTLDAVATPLLDGLAVVGSLTFFSTV